MTPEKELEALLVTKLTTALPAGVQAVRKQQITTAATLPRVVVACDVSTENQALAQVGVFSVSVEVQAMFDAIAETDPASTVQSVISAVDSTLLNWQELADTSVICLGGTFGTGSTANDEDRLVRTISGTLWARRRVVIPPAPTGNMIASGAGKAGANGLYILGAPINGKPAYYKDGWRIEWKTGFPDAWQFQEIGLGQPYASSENVATPDLVTTWNVIGLNNPAPTVTAEMSAPVII
jgi:hypothetical protein